MKAGSMETDDAYLDIGDECGGTALNPGAAESRRVLSSAVRSQHLCFYRLSNKGFQYSRLVWCQLLDEGSKGRMSKPGIFFVHAAAQQTFEHLPQLAIFFLVVNAVKCWPENLIWRRQASNAGSWNFSS